MEHSRRSARLLAAVERLLSPDNLLSNVYLVSQMLPGNRAPVASLLSMRSIARLNPSVDEFIRAASRSKQFAVVPSLDGPCIVPSFPVLQNVLIIRSAGLTSTVFQIGTFLGRLAGGHRFVAYPTITGYDFAVNFEKVEACIATWRALLIVPFEGRRLSVVAYSPVLLYQRSLEGSAKPAPPMETSAGSEMIKFSSS
jgi:hypothetical protein